MSSRLLRTLLVLICPATFFAMAAGCGMGNNGLPQTVTVELPDGTTTEATLGSGVITLADTTWDFFNSGSNAQGAAFVRVKFDSEGSLSRFDNNTIAREIFGDTLIFDGQRHATSQEGLEYAAATFGAETSDSSGFTFETELTAFAAGFEAASATATAQAEFDPDDPNVVRGTFSFVSEVTLLDYPEGNIDDTFNFTGRKVE